MKNSQGFTLLEIVVVLAIIGIIIVGALLSFGDFGHKKRLATIAEQWISDIKLLQHQAILETTTFGINLTPKGYNVFRFEINQGWKPIKNVPIKRAFPEKIAVWLSTQEEKNPTSPQIILNSAGDITPFSLYMGTSRESPLLVIHGKENGTLSLLPLTPP